VCAIERRKDRLQNRNIVAEFGTNNFNAPISRCVTGFASSSGAILSQSPIAFTGRERYARVPSLFCPSLNVAPYISAGKPDAGVTLTKSKSNLF